MHPFCLNISIVRAAVQTELKPYFVRAFAVFASAR